MITALALASAITATCEWSHPRGLRPLTEPFDTVIQRYTEIPSDVRQKLIADVRGNRFVDQVTIKRDGIKGDSGAEYADLRQMHFAGGLMCNSVTMRTWTDKDAERALIYQATDAAGNVYTLARPEICRNFSLVTMTKPPASKTPPPVATVPPVEPVAGDQPMESPRMSLAFVDPQPVVPPMSLDAEFAFPEPSDSFERISADQVFY